MSVKVNCAIVCDSVRQEINGKLIFVGVYTGDIVVQRYPVDISLQVWLEIQPEFTGHSEDFNVRIRLGPDEDVVLGELGATMEKENAELPIGASHISLPSISFHIQRSSDFIVEIRAGEEDWVQVLKKKIIRQSDIDDL